MRKLIKTITTVLLSSLILTSCGSSSVVTDDTLSGYIVLNGSSSMETVVNALVSGYKSSNPNVEFKVSYTGSDTGVDSTFTGLADIGNVSRELKTSETSNGLVSNVIAIDGLAVVVDVNNDIDSLTIEELNSIFSGTITNWESLGGDDTPIILRGREDGSGTRSAFEDLINADNTPDYSSLHSSTSDMLSSVANTEGAIGYVSIDSLTNSSAKAININGVEPTTNNVSSGKYTLVRPFVMATKKEISKQSDAVQDFFSYVKSDTGKKIVENTGLVSPN